jgi:hypothetical protein
VPTAVACGNLVKKLKVHADLHGFDTGKVAIAEAMIWASLLAALLKRP